MPGLLRARHGPADPRAARRLVTAVCIVLMTLVYGLGVHEGDTAHYDHALFRDTLQYQREGQDFYHAFKQAYADRGVTVDEVRAYREPAPFLVWRWLPYGWLWPAYLAVVVVGSSFLLLALTDHPLAVLPVTAYLLLSGRIPSNPAVDQYLLVEPWTVPLLAGAAVAWKHGRHAIAAPLAILAPLIRETAAGFLAAAVAIGAWRRDRRALVAYLGAAAAGLAAYLLHGAMVRPLLDDTGNQAQLMGTGNPPSTVLNMMGWNIPGPDLPGAVAYVVGLVWLLRRRRDVLPLVGLFAVAAGGLWVARPYWGVLFTPFALLLTGDAVGTVLEERAARTVTAEATPAGAAPR